MSFQIGDVVRHRCSTYWEVGVISAPREGHEAPFDCVWAYWRRPHGENNWCSTPLRTAERDLVPHEAPGPILAEFVAWRLTQ